MLYRRALLYYRYNDKRNSFLRKHSWFVHRGQRTAMLENQDLEPRIFGRMVLVEGVRRPTQGPSKT